MSKTRDKNLILGVNEKIIFPTSQIYDTTSGLVLTNYSKGGGQYVSRGDPATPDWDSGTLTLNGNWQNLDCSSIVPSGATGIVFRVTLTDNIASSLFCMREDGNSNSINTACAYILVADQSHENQWIIPCGSSRIVEYYASNVTWSSVQITVCGWFI